MKEIITFCIQNFWLLLLIILFLSNERYFIAGILLVGIYAIFGDIPRWVFCLILMITIFTSYLHPQRFYKKLYKRKYERDINKYINSHSK